VGISTIGKALDHMVITSILAGTCRFSLFSFLFCYSSFSSPILILLSNSAVHMNCGGDTSASLCQQVGTTSQYYPLGGAASDYSWTVVNNVPTVVIPTHDGGCGTDNGRTSYISVTCAAASSETTGTISFVNESPLCSYNFAAVVDCGLFVPNVTEVTGPTTAGGPLVITGERFSDSIAYDITFDGHDCEKVTYVSETELTCDVPSGYGGGHSFTFSDGTTSYALTWSYAGKCRY
jgi:hypothetical protein